MTATAHYDRGSLNAPTTGLTVGRAAKLHDASSPLVYDTGPEYRDATELAKIADDLARGVVVVWNHGGPKVGITTGARIDGDHVEVDMDLDNGTRTRVRTERRELSLGYWATLDSARYQRNIQVFELALVERGRCGGSCAITHADCADAPAPACACQHDDGASGDAERARRAKILANLERVGPKGKSERELAEDLKRKIAEQWRRMAPDDDDDEPEYKPFDDLPTAEDYDD